MNEVDAGALQEKQRKAGPPLILDVRNPPELAAEGRIEGSMNIPMNELPARLADVPEGREVVAACKAGMRSLNAAPWLPQTGRSPVSLGGGYEQWKAPWQPAGR